MNFSRGISDIKCGGIIRYRYPRGQIIFNVEKYIDDIDGVERYKYDYAECDDITSRSRKIEAIIRSRYSQDEVEAIMANYLTDGENDEHNEFQKWRKVAKIVASGVYEKSEIENSI